MSCKKTFKSTEGLLAGMGLSPETAESTVKAIDCYSIAQKLTILRARAGLTQKELAAKAGLSASAISHAEIAHNELQRLKDIVAYAKAFGYETVITLRKQRKAAKAARPEVWL